MNIKLRQQILLRHPRIFKLEQSLPCEGIKWSTVALRDLYSWGPKGRNRPRGIQEHSRCKKQGWWAYIPRKKASYPTGITESKALCWHHFVDELNSHSRDLELLTIWWLKQPEVIEYIKQNHEEASS